METLTDSVFRLLLTYPRQSWIQRELASRARCSPGHVSRIISSLVSSGVVSQPYKNRVRLVSPAKLLTLWAARRRMPGPLHVSTRLGQEEIESALQGQQGVALTLFSAAWHRTKFMSSATVEVYALPERVEALITRFGSPSEQPTSLSIYPAEGMELEGNELVDDLPLVSVPQNYVDLMSVGGQGPRVAIHLAQASGLLGE